MSDQRNLPRWLAQLLPKDASLSVSDAGRRDLLKSECPFMPFSLKNGPKMESGIRKLLVPSSTPFWRANKLP